MKKSNIPYFVLKIRCIHIKLLIFVPKYASASVNITMAKIRYCFFLLLLLAASTQLLATERVYNVLYINSTNSHTPWVGEQAQGLRAGFAAAKVKVNIVTEYLDAEAWVYSAEKEIMRRICERARKRGTDIIVTSGDEAFFTLFDCGNSLPYETPVIFYGMKYPDKKLLKGLKNVSGYTTTPDFNQLLEQAKSIYPGLREVVCVSDNSFLSRRGKERFEEGWKRFSQLNPGCEYSQFNVETDVTDKIIASICNVHNSYGRIVVAPKWSDFLSFLGKNSKSPFFSTQCESLTNGVFCAYDADPFELSKLAAVRAGKILQGEKPADLGISPIQLDFIYDYKQLKFFHVSQDRVKGGIILNVPFNEKYQLLFILLYTFVVALLIAIAVWLIRTNRRESRRRMQAQTRLLVQNRLVAQRDEFDNIFHSIRDGVITYDLDSRIHFTNRSLLRMLHLPDNAENRPYEGMEVGTIFKLFNNGQEILPYMLKQVMKKEKRLVIPDNSFVQESVSGIYFPISGEIVPLFKNGKVSGAALSFRNVSDEEMNKRFFNLAIEESSIYPWQFNVRSGLFSFPAGYRKIFGLEGDITRTTLENMVHPGDAEEVRRMLDLLLSGQSPRASLTYRQLNAVGKYEWWEFRTSTLSGMTADTPYYVLGVCQSIQRYKDTEAELTEARDKALQADKLKTAFLANMSHEIRTPLNAIVGFSDLLSDTSDFSEEDIANFIYTINRNCGLLLALINDILDLSRIESGTMEFQFAEHSLSLLLKGVYSSQLLNMPPDVQLVLDTPADNTKVIITDNVRLQQVINNLVNNAAKFTPNGTITLGYRDEADGGVSLFVKDTGMGISQEGLDHIFERFYKVDNFTQGAGLGLSICMTIVERLHGTISVDSQEGKGTCFTVKLPQVVDC